MLLPAPATRRNLLGALGAGALAAVLCLLLLWRNPQLFFNDDYAISILPVLTDVARSWREGHWPLLSPYGWACSNLAGEYQYGTFSLFLNAVVVAVWHWPMTFANQAAAMSITHLAVMAAGAFLLARRRRLPASLATVVALVAALNGWMVGWGATDWFGALAAEAWLPWCWWAFEEAMWPHTPPGETALRARLRFLLPVPFVYLLLAAGFPYTVVMLALVSAWLAAWALAGGRPRALWPLAAGWGLGLGLAAPAWLSLLTYMAGSNRAHGAGAGNFAWTVPLSAWPGMILPNWTTLWPDFANHPGMHAALELSGAFVPVVALMAALGRRRRALWRAAHWELGLLGIVTLLCVLPSPGVFRWSFRWLPLFHLVLALAGGRALLLLASSRPRKPSSLGQCLACNPGAWAFAAVATTWEAMNLAHTANHDAITRDLPWLMLIIAALWMVLDAALMRRRPWSLWIAPAVVFASLLTTYLHMYTNPGVPIFAFGPSLTHIAPLAVDRLYLSVYQEPDLAYGDKQTPPDFGGIVRPGSTGMYAGVHLLNAYSPIMAQGIGKRLSMETHGNIPAAMADDLLQHEAGPDGLLARLGVDGLIVAHAYEPLRTPPPANEWTPVFSAPEGTIYHRRGGARPDVQAWTTDGHAGTQLDTIAASRLEAAANVRVPAGGAPGLVAFRRPFFPGYVALLDGVKLPVTSFEGLLPTVELPPGSHGRLVLRYRPPAVVWGVALAAISLAGMAGFAGLALIGRKRLATT